MSHEALAGGRWHLVVVVFVLSSAPLCIPGAARAQRACGDGEFGVFDDAATVIEQLEEQSAHGETVAVPRATATVNTLGELSTCEGVLGRRALLFLARAHTLRGDSLSQNIALSLLRQRNLSPEERKDVDARYPPDGEERVPLRSEPESAAPAATAVSAPPEDPRVREELGSGLAKVKFERRGDELRFRALTDEADAVRALVVRWNPTGGGWQRVVLEGDVDSVGTVRFTTRLEIPKQGRCFVQITAKRQRAPAAASPEFVLNTKEMGRSTVRREFVIAPHGILSADSWYDVDRRSVRVAVRRHGSAVRVTITTHVFDGVAGAVIRWNPIGGGWLSRRASGQRIEAGAQGFAANLSVAKEGLCYIEVVLKMRKGDARLITFEVNTESLSATMPLTEHYSPWR